MKKTIFLLMMLFSPNIFAATLTPNTIPYVCQGGSSPQLCSSKMTTDSNGNVIGLGAWTTQATNVVYQASTDVYVTAVADCYTEQAIYLYSDSTSNPSALKSAFSSGVIGSGVYQIETVSSFIKKGDYYKITGSCSMSSINVIPNGT